MVRRGALRMMVLEMRVGADHSTTSNILGIKTRPMASMVNKDMEMAVMDIELGGTIML